MDAVGRATGRKAQGKKQLLAGVDVLVMYGVGVLVMHGVDAHVMDGVGVLVMDDECKQSLSQATIGSSLTFGVQVSGTPVFFGGSIF